jgi:peptide/nickel transport system substrate-binding protein
VVNHINDSLLYFKPDASLGNALAESWKEADALTYIYQIRQGVQFSDGSPLTVEDVIFSLERIRDPKLASDENWMYANVDSIAQTGDWEITVKLARPDATWRYVPATSGGEIVSKAYVESKGDAYGKPNGGALGTGPYKLEKWVPGSQFILTRNEYYWDKNASIDIDKVTVNIIPNLNAVQLALESGQAGFTISSVRDLLSVFENSATLKVVSRPSISNRVLSFNTRKAPFNDVNVRKAIASAVDNVGIRKSQVGDYGVDAGDLPFSKAGYTLGDRQGWIDFNETLPDYSYDLSKARAFLARSSVPNGFSTSLYYKPDAISHNAAQAIQASLKALNIAVELRQLQASEYYAYAYGGKITDGIRDYDMGINDWSPDFPDPAGHLLPQYQGSNSGEGGANYAAYQNDQVDELCARQNAATDPNERAKLIQQAFFIAASEAPYKYLYYNNNSIVIDKKFDYELSPMWIFNFYYKDIKLVR